MIRDSSPTECKHETHLMTGAETFTDKNSLGRKAPRSYST